MSYRLSNYEHVPHNIVEHEHIENLLKLREHLLRLPEDYKHFNMHSYASNGAGKSQRLYQFLAKQSFFGECGTTGCAIGHTFAAGIVHPDEIPINRSWSELAWKVYGIDYGAETENAWLWCFDCDWARVDNTPQGAGHRIGYMLQHNIPVETICDRKCVVFSPAIYQPA